MNNEILFDSIMMLSSFILFINVWVNCINGIFEIMLMKNKMLIVESDVLFLFRKRLKYVLFVKFGVNVVKVMIIKMRNVLLLISFWNFLWILIFVFVFCWFGISEVSMEVMYRKV